MKVMHLLFSLFFLTATTFVQAMEPTANCRPYTINKACEQGNLAAVQRFIEQDPTSINRQEISQNFTPLCVAIRKGHESIVQFLLAHESDINRGDCIGRTPLHLAIVFIEIAGNERIVRLLLEHGASIDAQDNDDNTPLHTAAFYAEKAIAQLLLEHGARMDLRNIAGETPVQAAQRSKDARLTHPYNRGNRRRENDITYQYQNFIDLLQGWPQILAQRQKAARLAFCEALHPRLGAGSLAHIMPQDVPQEIFKYNRPEDFAGVKLQPASPSKFGSRCTQISAAVLLLATVLGTWQLCHH